MVPRKTRDQEYVREYEKQDDFVDNHHPKRLECWLLLNERWSHSYRMDEDYDRFVVDERRLCCRCFGRVVPYPGCDLCFGRSRSCHSEIENLQRVQPRDCDPKRQLGQPWLDDDGSPVEHETGMCFEEGRQDVVFVGTGLRHP
jgi:hypothetical protein